MDEAPASDYATAALALRYAAAGVRVLPLQWVVCGRCSCGRSDCSSIAKHPLINNGAHGSSSDPATVESWFKRWPLANIGMTLDGLVVIDVDPRNGGVATFDDLTTSLGALPDTWTQRTGGGGNHYVFKARPSERYRGILGAGVDLKHGGGQFIVVEPSMHVSGVRYVWLDESGPFEGGKLADAPEWLCESRASAQVLPGPNADKIGAGARNNYLYERARRLRDLSLSSEEIQAALMVMNTRRCAPPMSVDEVRTIAKNAGQNEAKRPDDEPATVVPLDWKTLVGQTPPGRRWAIESWFGMGHTTLLAGSGGIGKTLLGQTIGSALAIGRDYIGRVPEARTVLMWACEDDMEELWRRQCSIAAFFGVPLDAFVRFILIPRVGMDNVLLSTEFGRPMWTPRMGELQEQVNDYKANFLIVDNTAQTCAGENDRHTVTVYTNAMSGIGISSKLDTACVLISHPSKGMDSEFSGSTAWENAVRSRMYLGAKLPDQTTVENEPDDLVRFLCKRKTNYSVKDYSRLTYDKGVLVPDEAVAGGALNGYLRKAQAERVITDGLRKILTMGKQPTDGATSPEYMPRLLVEFRLNEGFSQKELKTAMQELMVAGRIKRGVVGQYSNRSPRFGLIES